MRSKFLFNILLLICLANSASAIEIKVLQFNIWQEGTVVKGGFDAIVDEIIANRVDIVTFSEVRNYNNTKFNERIVAALQAHGVTYYSFLSYDSGIISRFPIESFATIFPLNKDHGSVYKAVIKIGERKVVVYTGHLDYLNAANYPMRGYDGNTWKPLAAKVSSVTEIIEMNLASQRDEAIQLLLKDAAKERKRKSTVIIGGDFNEPSHLDWKSDTKNLYDHHGLVVPWHNSIALEHAGLKDAYRELYPNPITHPGFTFPAFNKDIDIKKLIWADGADDRDRIDFIYYLPKQGLKLKSISILGPSASVVNSRPLEESSADPFIAPQKIWPTDHKALLATFLID
jgi:hypothetical protein